jgi:hypothetical protein
MRKALLGVVVAAAVAAAVGAWGTGSALAYGSQDGPIAQVEISFNCTIKRRSGEAPASEPRDLSASHAKMRHKHRLQPAHQPPQNLDRITFAGAETRHVARASCDSASVSVAFAACSSDRSRVLLCRL